MANYSSAEIAIARRAGIDAAKAHRPRAPWSCLAISQMIAEKQNAPMGSCLPILEAFSSGYQSVCDAQARAILERA